jgi:hypothetical protein
VLRRRRMCFEGRGGGWARVSTVETALDHGMYRVASHVALRLACAWCVIRHYYTRKRHSVSSAVHYRNAAATVSYLWDALVVQLPSSELADDEGGQ